MPSARPESPFPPHFDALSRNGALLIAQHIEAFWKQRGFGRVRAQRYELRTGSWGVRSNLVNGLPPPSKGCHTMLTINPDAKSLGKRKREFLG